MARAAKDLTLETELWEAATALRGSMDATDSACSACGGGTSSRRGNASPSCFVGGTTSAPSGPTRHAPFIARVYRSKPVEFTDL